MLRPKENIFPSRDGFSIWLRAWLFAEFSAIPETMREEFLQDFVNTYMSQDGSMDSEGKDSLLWLSDGNYATRQNKNFKKLIKYEKNSSYFPLEAFMIAKK